MENKTIKKALSFQNTTRRLLAVLLILAMLSFVGCKGKDKDKGKGDDKDKVTSSQVTSSEDTSSDDLDNEDDDSSKTDKSPTSSSVASGKVDPARGDLTYSADITSNPPRDDANEIIPTGNCANLSNPITGHYEAEATAARNRILNTKNTADLYEIKGTTYYVSPGGDDSNAGKSPEFPLRTIDAVQDLKLEKGDAVLFERDSVFRIVSALNTTEGVIYGSYGEGEKPKIYASPLNFATVEWEPYHRKNIWMTNFIYGEACGLFIDHGKECGIRKNGPRALENNAEFYVDQEKGILYMYCDKGNPAKVYDDIEVSPRMQIFKVPGHKGNVVIDNICMKYSGSIAVEITFNNHDVTVTNCEIGYTGGFLYDGSVRAGNAIQAWQGIQGFVVKNCWIYQTWDTAISWQGQSGNPDEKPAGSIYSDIVHNDNLLEYNNADFEFWDHDNNTEVLDGFEIKNNICRFTSLGWGTRLLDGGYRGIEGVFGNCITSDMVIKKKIIVENTIIDCPGREIISWYIRFTPAPKNEDKGAQMWDLLDVSGTKVFVNKDYRTFNRSLRGCRRVEEDQPLTSYSSHKTLVESIKRFDPFATVMSVGFPDSNG